MFGAWFANVPIFQMISLEERDSRWRFTKIHRANLSSSSMKNHKTSASSMKDRKTSARRYSSELDEESQNTSELAEVLHMRYSIELAEVLHSLLVFYVQLAKHQRARWCFTEIQQDNLSSSSVKYCKTPASSLEFYRNPAIQSFIELDEILQNTSELDEILARWNIAKHQRGSLKYDEG